MRKNRIYISLIFSLIAIATFAAPRLTVVAVVDGLCAENLEILRPYWQQGGIRTLSEEAFQTTIAYPHLVYGGNETTATLMTGTTPDRHGYTMDTYYVRRDRKIHAMLEDSDVHGIGTVEGGDVQIIRDDVVICGLGARTNMHGVEGLVEHLKTKPGVKHLIFQELPLTPESFIHLDMVFTMLDVDKCMIYEPVIMNSAYKTFHITVDGQKAVGKEVPDLLAGLKELGIDLEPVYCGNRNNDWAAREQWHSGCNFFCFEPGKFIGYGRNQHTLEALNKAGFNILTASDVANNKVDVNKVRKCIVAFEGNELSRGGGGARCMTMPGERLAVEW